MFGFLPLSPDTVLVSQLTIRGVRGWTANDFAAAVRINQPGKINLRWLVTYRFTLDKHQITFQITGQYTLMVLSKPRSFSNSPASELSLADQRALYDEHGYLVFPELLDAVELAALRTAVTEVLREADELTESNDRFSITRTDDGGFSVRRIFDPIARHQAFHDLVFNPKILDVVENLIGPNIQLHHTKLNLKPPSSREARFEWHQDYPFFPHTNFDLLAVMIYFDDSTEENGCLTIVPGSRKWGPQNHLFARDGAFSSQLEDKGVVQDPTGWLKVPVPAGGMELHHCNMLHSSTANSGTRPRSAMVIQYRAADNVALGGNMSNAGFGLQVRGENPYTVRMIGGTFKLPGVITDPLQRDG